MPVPVELPPRLTAPGWQRHGLSPATPGRLCLSQVMDGFVAGPLLRVPDRSLVDRQAVVVKHYNPPIATDLYR